MHPIKLVACDIDGTLLQPGQTQIAPEVFEQIRRLQQKGILFCPASGRQHHSLQNLFAPVADSLYYLCENGSVIFAPNGSVLSKTVISRALAKRVIDKMLATPDCEALISGENVSYLITENASYIRHIKEEVGNLTRVVRSVGEIDEDIIKLAMYCPMGADMHLAAFQNAFGGELSVARGGKCWVDLTLADKGTGMRALCAAVGVSLQNVMAIGDNDNDLPMLSIVGQPVLMENAADALKKRFATRCQRVEDTLAAL